MQPVGIGGGIDIGIVDQQVAPWIDPDDRVIGAARFNGDGTVIDRNRWVVDRGEDDLQSVGVAQGIGGGAGQA
ncbi:hypothetical protein D3C85_978590 [compost metagenome]